MFIIKPKVTSDYGVKRVLPDGKEQIHDGIDIISETDNRFVYSFLEGYIAYDFDDYCHVKRYEKPNTAGNMIIVTTVVNDKTYHVRFLHLEQNYVYKGQIVFNGLRIGKYGDVGYSFGAHLHLDVYDANWTKKVNPYEVFPALRDMLWKKS